MADIKSILSEEIRRLSRKEIKAAIEPLQLKIAELKKSVSLLSKALKTSKANVKAVSVAADVVVENNKDAKKTFRFNAVSIKKLRTKLKLSQANFAKLVGVSTLTVSCWELGKTSPRAAAKANLASLRHIGKRALDNLIKDRNIG